MVFPVKHINYRKTTITEFQVESGPIPFLFGNKYDNRIKSVYPTYIAFNSLNEVSVHKILSFEKNVITAKISLYYDE